MTIAVKFGGDPIAKSPFTVGVAAPLDLDKVTLDNLDGSKKSVYVCIQLDLSFKWCNFFAVIIKNVEYDEISLSEYIFRNPTISETKWSYSSFTKQHLI